MATCWGSASSSPRAKAHEPAQATRHCRAGGARRRVLRAPGPGIEPEDFAAAEVPVEIPSGGAMLRGTMYVAAGRGPHHTVVMLDGNPGVAEWPGLARAIQASGRNAMFVHYRGSWTSDGEFSLANAREDVRRMLAFASFDAPKRRFRASGEPAAIVGRRLGAWLALEAAAETRTSECVAAMSLGDFEGYVATVAPGLRDHPVLLLDATTDAIAPVADQLSGPADALRRAGARLVVQAAPGLGRREADSDRAVVDWLTRECRR